MYYVWIVELRYAVGMFLVPKPPVN